MFGDFVKEYCENHRHPAPEFSGSMHNLGGADGGREADWGATPP